ncbi:VOC family protein [Vibrio rumoiensis]|uniref:VOC domain-containing protein n=1 Tax=Vibrio rumoiensis 1S-45 TaxID=1188252 RepID=A0A1E5DYQ9_9VIBR|nr:VOC family protein [Vibrio rumoiensis]OEF22862.1 hypothetical protein A1QC_13320 [Vibrio rumoiensis 1S-45]
MKLLSSKWLAIPAIGSLSILLAACSSSPSLTLPALSNSANKTQGNIIWRDLVTTSPEEVKPFYHNVFGWQFETINNDYSLITYQGHYIAGMAKVPTNSTTNYWLPVMSSDNVDLTISKAEQAGATTLIQKTTLKGRGDIAVIQDPQGAVFSVLNTVSGDPSALPKQSGNWIWQEVWTQDINQSQQFYQQLDQFSQGKKTIAQHDYHYLSVNNNPAFGFVKKPNSDVPTTWVNYIKVDDVNETIAKVKQNGGIVLMEPNKAVRNGSVAVIRDPAGAGFVVQEVKK